MVCSAISGKLEGYGWNCLISFCLGPYAALRFIGCMKGSRGSNYYELIDDTYKAPIEYYRFGVRTTYGTTHSLLFERVYVPDVSGRFPRPRLPQKTWAGRPSAMTWITLALDSTRPECLRRQAGKQADRTREDEIDR